MRLPILAAATVALLACTGSRIESSGRTRTSAVDRSPMNPSGETTEYSTSLAVDTRPKPPPAQDERASLLASDGNGYFWVRAEDGGFVRAMGSDRRWQAPVYEVETATEDNVKPGDRVFFARLAGGLTGALAPWRVGTVDRIDRVFKKAYVLGQVYDLGREVLRAKDPLEENAPAQ